MRNDSDDVLVDAGDEPDDAADPTPVERDRAAELASSDGIRKTLKDLYIRIQQGFTDQIDRTNDQMDYWDAHDCKLGPKQVYSGNSQLFIPIIANAIKARVTRFTNQVFPQSGRHVEVITSDEKPRSIMALLEHYIRRAKMRTLVMPPLMKNGDVEGQY